MKDSTKTDPLIEHVLEHAPFAEQHLKKWHHSLLQVIGSKVQVSLSILSRIFTRRANRQLRHTQYAGTHLAPKLHPGITTLTGYYLILTGLKTEFPRITHVLSAQEALKDPSILVSVKTTALTRVSLAIRARPSFLVIADVNYIGVLVRKMFMIPEHLAVTVTQDAARNPNFVEIKYHLPETSLPYRCYMHRFEIFADLAKEFAEYFEICSNEKLL